MSIIPIFIPHAGCPHQCVFCNQKKISGQKIASAAAVREQITKYLQWVKPGPDNEAAFYGGSFTGLEAALQEELFIPVDELLRTGVIGSVRCSTRPDYITAEKLELLKRHNVTTVELGVQSLDDKVLALAERGHDAASVAKAVQLLRAYGFKVGLQLMCGMPGQTAASFFDTVAKSIALKPDMVRLYPLLVIKDTPLEDSYKRGDFTPLTVDEAAEFCAAAWESFTAAGIKVIRTGLQPDKELCSPGNIVAGPFHPAFGEIVKSMVLRQKLTPEILKILQSGSKKVKIYVPHTLESKLRGQKNANIKYWQSLGAQVEVLRTDDGPLKAEGAENE